MYYIGIDLGGTRVKLGLVLAGTVVARRTMAANVAGGLEASLRAVDVEIGELLREAGGVQLGGIGLAFPGLVDPVASKVLSTNKQFADALTVDLRAWARDRWGVGFFMDNDARMATVGEWKYGAGRGTDDLVVMTIGTGIGTSVILEGKLLRGRHFQAGCLGGHLSVRYDGRPCNCGNMGCMEAYGATWSLVERVREAPEFPQSVLSAAPVIDFEALFAAADGGDALARRMEEDCLGIWSAGIVNMIHAYDPEVVVLGGGVMK
ncbi:MAG: ROK family protein, partial [Bacteroidetes bacterium]|nr:ROK family protein [Bacteroidota bacterium]